MSLRHDTEPSKSHKPGHTAPAVNKLLATAHHLQDDRRPFLLSRPLTCSVGFMSTKHKRLFLPRGMRLLSKLRTPTITTTSFKRARAARYNLRLTERAARRKAVLFAPRTAEDLGPSLDQRGVKASEWAAPWQGSGRRPGGPLHLHTLGLESAQRNHAKRAIKSSRQLRCLGRFPKEHPSVAHLPRKRST